jgi:transglutaminase-like putative cysteine protease
MGAIAPTAEAVAPQDRPRGFGPAEGWITVLLHLTLIVLMAGSMAGIGVDDRRAVLVPLATGGALFGLVVAKSRLADALAHAFSLALASGFALLLAGMRAQELNGGWRLILARLEERLNRLLLALVDGSALTTEQLVMLTGVLVWLLGYSSAWMLYRRAWGGPATILPGALILASLALDRSQPSRPLFLYLIVALALNARHFAYRRQQDWQRARMPAPRGLGARCLIAGAWLAIIAVTAGLTLPARAPERLVQYVADQADRSWQEALDVYNWLAERGPGHGQGTYADFPDSFQVGGPLSLTDDPVAILRAQQPHYLAARRYDMYDGEGWRSGVDETYRFPGESSKTQAKPVGYRAAQSVALSDSVRRRRTEEIAQVELLQPTRGLLLTIDTYAGASVATQAIVGWQQFNELAIDVNEFDPRQVPVDLYSLIALLQQATLQPAPDGSEPVITDPQLAGQVAAIRERLRRDYPVETRLSLVGGRVILTVSGRLPNYDDIEAVLATNASDGKSYLITGLASIATPDELRAAGQDYPDYIIARYLQLPGSVTPRTRALAQRIVEGAGATNPFDAMVALQEYLRSGAFAYDVNNGWLPEPGTDQVDAFLFEERVGRCEHFATAMVVLARTLGVPARLVSGYYQGTFDPRYQGYVSRANQAHTWVEVFFPGYGWVPFEPTPSQPTFQYGDEQLAPVPTPEPTPAPDPTPEPEPTAGATPAPVADPVTSEPDHPSFYERTIGQARWLAALVTLLTFAAAAVLALAWAWGLRGLRPAAALYARTLRIGRFWGVQAGPTTTPHEFAAELARRAPVSRAAVQRVAELYAAEQYGRRPLSKADTESGRVAWQALRRSVMRWRPWRRVS